MCSGRSSSFKPFNRGRSRRWRKAVGRWSYKSALASRYLAGVVIGGICRGFFTPVEAGGAGAMAAFFPGMDRREMSLRLLWDVALETGCVTAAIIFLSMAAQIHSRIV